MNNQEEKKREIIWKIVLVAALTLSYVSCDNMARGLDNLEENGINYSEKEQFIYPILEAAAPPVPACTLVFYKEGRAIDQKILLR